MTASVPRALTLIAGITGAIRSSSAVTDSAKPGARPIPPPSTIRSGSTTVMTAQMVLATSRASSATTAWARAVAGRRGLEDAPRGHRAAHAPATRGPDDPGGRRGRLERAALARLVLVGARAAGQRHERDLPGHPVGAAQQLAAER